MFLKQSTSAVVLVGPVLDSSGVAVTTAVIGDFTLSKNGTSAAMSGNTITHSHNGHYAITLTAANTDTIGRLTISVNNTAQAMPVFRWDICQPTVYDALFANATNTTGGLPAATGTISALAGAVSTYAGGDTAGTTTLLTRLPSAISLSSGAVTVGTNNDKSGYSLTAGTGLGNQTANITGNLSGSVGSVAGAVGSVTTRVTANTDQWGGVAVTGMPMPTYTQPTGFLAATFPTTVSSYAGGAVASVTGNVGGNVVGSVGSISGVTFPTHFSNLVIAANGHVTATVDAINNNAITASAIQANAITAAKIAADAIGAAQLAADAVTEIQSGLATAAAVATLTTFVDTEVAAIKTVTDKLNTGLVQDGLVWQFTANMLELSPVGGGGAGDASQATLLQVQGTVNDIAASLSGTPIEVVGRVADGGSITLYAGDDMRVRSGTEISVTITDVGGAIYSRLNTIGIANLAFGASRPSQPAGAIDGTVAALSQAGAGAAQTVTIDIEITDGGQGLAYADNYVWQIVSSQAQGSEYDTYTEIEGSLAVRRRVAVPVHA